MDGVAFGHEAHGTLPGRPRPPNRRPARPGARIPPSPPKTILAFAGISGFFAIAYQTLYYQYGLVWFGVTYHAFIGILFVIMLGNAVGAAVGGRLADAAARPLAVYGLLELALAACTAASPWTFPLAARLAARLGEGDLFAGQAFVARMVALVVAVAVPATLVGAFFPVFGRAWLAGVRARGARAAVMSAAYNGLGALAALGIGAWAIHRTHLYTLTWSLAAAHAAVALVAIGVGGRTMPAPPPPASPPLRDDLTARPWPAGLLLGLGFVLTAYENAAFRAGAMARTHTFNAGYPFLLTLVLVGLGAGATWFNARASDGAGPGVGRTALRVASLGALATSLGAHFGDALTTGSDFADDRPTGLGSLLPFPALFTVAVVVTMAAVGVLFSVAYAGAVRRAGAGRDIARTSVLTTIGAAIGSFAPGLLLLPVLGAAPTMLLLAVALWGASLALPAARVSRATELASHAVAVVVTVGVASLGTVYRPFTGPDEQVLFHHDGWSVSTLVTGVPRQKGGMIEHIYHNAKRVSTAPAQAGEFISLAPILARPDAEEAFLVGYANGHVSSLLLRSPALRRLTVVDLDESVPDYQPIFASFNHDALADPRVVHHVDDGRRWLEADAGTYDVVLADVYGPKRALFLYTREFLDTARARLKPRGVVAVKAFGQFASVAATVVAAFPHHLAWAEPSGPGMIVLLGSDAPFSLDLAAMRAAWDRTAAELSDSGEVIGFDRILCGYLGDERDLDPLAAGIVPLSDFSYRLADPDADRAYVEGLRARRRAAPEGLLDLVGAGTPEAREAARAALRSCWR